GQSIQSCRQVRLELGSRGERHRPHLSSRVFSLILSPASSAFSPVFSVAFSTPSLVSCAAWSTLLPARSAGPSAGFSLPPHATTAPSTSIEIIATFFMAYHPWFECSAPCTGRASGYPLEFRRCRRRVRGKNVASVA